MATDENKSIRTDLLLLGCAGVIIVGGCITSAFLLRGLFEGTERAPPGDEIVSEAPPVREIRIPIDAGFSDTTASERGGKNLHAREWISFGVYEGTLHDVSLLRFRIDLAKDARVPFATIEFHCSEAIAGWGGAYSRNRINLIDSSDQGPFAERTYPTYESLDRLPSSGTGVRWTTGPWRPGEVYRTSNIAPLVQAFLRREDYAPGQYIGLKITGEPRGSSEGYSRLYPAVAMEAGNPAVLILRQ
ncbi:MAG: hypothetical protein O7H41_00360 [Planctomycetota bacterium]|nr:hypothetical protein [Planctomycetota bacterium]